MWQDKNFYMQDANKKWQDWCAVVLINGRLVPVPYSEAKNAEEYELGTAIAAIAANRIIRKLVAMKS